MAESAHASPKRRLPGEAKTRLLRSLARHHFLTAAQLCSLHYAATALTRPQTLLKELHTDGFVHCRPAAPKPGGGSYPAVYSLARPGRSFLAGLGTEITLRFHAKEADRIAPAYISHVLGISDFTVALELASRQLPELTVARQLHERELRQRPCRGVLTNGKTLGVVADTWLALVYEG